MKFVLPYIIFFGYLSGRMFYHLADYYYLNNGKLIEELALKYNITNEQLEENNKINKIENKD